MIPTSPFQFELAYLLLLDRQRKEAERHDLTPALNRQAARQSLVRQSLHHVGLSLVVVGRWLEAGTRPLTPADPTGEGGMVI